MAEFLTTASTIFTSPAGGTLTGGGLRIKYGEINCPGNNSATYNLSGFSKVLGAVCCLKNNTESGYSAAVQTVTPSYITVRDGGKDTKTIAFIVVGIPS